MGLTSFKVQKTKQKKKKILIIIKFIKSKEKMVFRKINQIIAQL